MSPSERLRQVNNSLLSSMPQREHIQDPNHLPWNPNSTRFPSRKELPRLPGAPEGAAWVWGMDDEVRFLPLNVYEEY